MEQLLARTRCAHWGYSDHQYFGHAVFAELLGRETLMSLSVLSVLGRRLSSEHCQLLEEAAVALTMADPRIWPLKLTRTVAAYGRALPAAAAGLFVLQEAQIGPWPAQQAAYTLQAFHARWDASAAASQVREDVNLYLKEHGFVWGFGTPFRERDERLAAFLRRLRVRGLDEAPYFRTYQRLAVAMKELCRVEPNIVSALSAVCLDLGLSPDEIGPLTTVLMQHMFLANAVEAARERPNCLRILPPAHVEYGGVAARRSPRALAAEQCTEVL